jgi:hypothetical protein
LLDMLILQIPSIDPNPEALWPAIQRLEQKRRLKPEGRERSGGGLAAAVQSISCEGW